MKVGSVTNLVLPVSSEPMRKGKNAPAMTLTAENVVVYGKSSIQGWHRKHEIHAYNYENGHFLETPPPEMAFGDPEMTEPGPNGSSTSSW
jgi:hypothetical protein